MVKSFVLVCWCILAVALSACSENETAPDPNDPNRQPLGTFKVDVNGVEYAPGNPDLTVRFKEETSALEIILIDQEILITFNLAESGFAKSHPLGPGQPSALVYRIRQTNTTSFSSLVEGASGNVLVGTFNPGNVTGTFSGTLVNTQDPEDKLVLANGVFNLRRDE